MPALALFPLNIVVFPGESLNLHIFEPRYRQLIADCIAEHITFGIPPFLDGRLHTIGTEVRLLEVSKRYEDGRMDIRTEGLRAFRLHSFDNPTGDRLYAGGEVAFLDLIEDATHAQKMLFVRQVEQLYDLLATPVPLNGDETLLSFRIAHKIGLSQAQEYQLLSLPAESQRIDMLNEHLSRVIPVVREMERTKERIRLNGHFKHIDPIKF